MIYEILRDFTRFYEILSKSQNQGLEHGRNRPINEDRAGNFVIICSEEPPLEQVYRICKTRCMIEGLFDSAKTVLSADGTHMQNDAHAMGHLLIIFLSVRVRTDILLLLEEAGPASSYSPEDVLDIYGTMKKFGGDAEIRQTVPKDVREPDAQLKMFLYSTQGDLDKIIREKEKRP